jgi:glycosyltransferase involved in cell wall biosynthesis
MVRALAEATDTLDVIPVLPVGCGYENIVEANRLSPVWFDQRDSHARRLLFDAVALPRWVRTLTPDAILGLGNVGVAKAPVPQIVLVHDSHLVYPKRHYGNETRARMVRHALQQRSFARCAADVSLVYCQTRTMLQRIRQVYDRVTAIKVLPNCLPSITDNSRKVAPVPGPMVRHRDRFRLICLTRYYAHKNLECIVEAFRVHRQELQGTVVYLTISAEQGIQARRLLRTIERLGLTEQIVNLGPVAQEEIPLYFRNCHAMLFPTILESFSTTYLEAMFCRLPILTSHLDFAREVCGNAALYFDPWSSRSMADAIARARRQPKLLDELADAGRRQFTAVHHHTWDDIAGFIVSDLRQLVRPCKGVQT